MKFSLLPLLALAASASPIINLAPRAEAGNFAITSFYNSGVPHSVVAHVGFTLTDASKSLVATCSASLAIQPTIATTAFPTTCNDTCVFFGFEYKVGVPGYWLTLAHVYNDNKTVDTGSYWLGADVKIYENPSTPTGNYDYLNVPTSFDVAYNRCTQA
ncbi:hypothetical protein TWF696_005495 [Orbilia brochopaga]|uniref:Uncharacterized protein n=1 Tax=Orbilia brochopaga TaxID=3140254 RepID=A0AAV9V483_9PEZI